MADLIHMALNLLVAVALGAAIGIERQWRQRLAGLRTNTLVALGSASFVAFAALFPGEASPTRIAAQVVSGIGFLGAGVIFKEGLNVRGLNTAATLWCSAAVGVLAGAGALTHAALVASLVVGINLLLRPLVARIARQPESAVELPTNYVVTVTCKGGGKKAVHIRAQLLQALTVGGLHLRGIDSISPGGGGGQDDGTSTAPSGGGRVEIVAELTAEAGRSDAILEQVVGRLSLEPTVIAARWRVAADTGGD